MVSWHRNIKITKRELEILRPLPEMMELTPQGDGYGNEPEVAEALMRVLVRNGALNGTMSHQSWAEPPTHDDFVGLFRMTFDVEPCFMEMLREAIEMQSMNTNRK